jgi:hypothetical protein
MQQLLQKKVRASSAEAKMDETEKEEEDAR